MASASVALWRLAGCGSSSSLPHSSQCVCVASSVRSVHWGQARLTVVEEEAASLLGLKNEVIICETLVTWAHPQPGAPSSSPAHLCESGGGVGAVGIRAPLGFAQLPMDLSGCTGLLLKALPHAATEETILVLG